MSNHFSNKSIRIKFYFALLFLGGISEIYSADLVGLEANKSFGIQIVNSDLFYEELSFFIKPSYYFNIQGELLSSPNQNRLSSTILAGALAHSLFFKYDYLINTDIQSFKNLKNHTLGYRFLLHSDSLADLVKPNVFVFTLSQDYVNLYFSDDIKPIHFGFEFDIALDNIEHSNFLKHYSYFMGYAYNIWPNYFNNYFCYAQSRFHFKQIQIDLSLILNLDYISIESTYIPENQNRISEWIFKLGFAF